MDNLNHKCSDGIRDWSVVFGVAGIILIIVSVFAWIAGGPGLWFFMAGISSIVLRILFKGFSIIVRNAETQLLQESDLP